MIYQKNINSNSTSYEIINICLIPDTVSFEATEFIEQIINLSKQQNTLSFSQYELCKAINCGDVRLSLTHCTVMHLKVKADLNAMKFLAKKLEFIMEQSYTLKITGIDVVSNASVFIKDNLLKSIPTLQVYEVQWASVEKDEQLLNLQEKVVSAIADQNVKCITGKEEHYRPHFTYWVKETKQKSDMINLDQQENLQNYSAKMKGLSVPCKVVIGSCGPIGQVTQVQHQQVLS